MSRSTHVLRRLVAICSLAGAVALGACSDAAIAAPKPRPSEIRVSHDVDPLNPPDAPCRSGWAVVNGRWECADM